MKKAEMWKNVLTAATCVCLAAGCKTPKALSAVATSGAVAIGAAAVQGALSAPSAEEKAAAENPSWVAVAETLTPSQAKAVGARLKSNGDAWQAWQKWKEYQHVRSGSYSPEAHAEVLRVCEEVRQVKVRSCFQWSPPDLEKRWARRLAGADSATTTPRLAGADAARGEALLEKFAATRMPASWARYREARKTAEDLERVLREEFPQGKESDPTGGDSYGRTRGKAVAAVAEMFRRHDELCFFFLMRKGGAFSDATLKKLDDRGGGVWLESESWSEGEGDLGELPVPGAEDAQFAREHLGESWQASQELVPLWEAGAAQCRELRKIAEALDAVRAGSQLALFRNRTATIRSALEETYRQFGVLRFQRRIGEVDDAALEEKDRETGAALRALKDEISLAKWVSQKGKMGVLELPGGETMDMVWCPPGSFLMGSPTTEAGRGTDEVQRKVTIEKGFWMAKCEVTEAQCSSVLAAHGNVTGVTPPKPEEASLPSTEDWLLDRFFEATMLTLPTEEEWEYACRAGNPGPYGGMGELDAMGWFAGNSGGKIHPVGGKSPNAWGLYDMHGNVWERCAGEGTPIRGGSIHDRAADCRAAFHDSLEQRIQNKAEKDMDTMLRRLREEGIDEVDLQRGFEWLPAGKREKLKRLYEEGVIVNPMATGRAILQNVGFRPVFREE